MTISEAMLDGTMCKVCGVFLGEGDGFPRLCADCQHPRRARSKLPKDPDRSNRERLKQKLSKFRRLEINSRRDGCHDLANGYRGHADRIEQRLAALGGPKP